MLELLWLFLVAVGLQLVFFVPAYFLKTDKFTDFTYGVTFMAMAYLALVSSSPNPAKKILFALILIWALRLVFYLSRRILKTRHDWRFNGVRENFRKFLMFWAFQGAAAWVIMLPALLLFFKPYVEISLVMVLGLWVWIAGLTIESVADKQKYEFRADPKNDRKWVDTGLWRYSRHPNYFGEVLCWVGVYLFTYTNLSYSERIIGLASPLLITSMLLFVTGIPALEKAADTRWGKLKAYKEYKRRTSPFLILPQRK